MPILIWLILGGGAAFVGYELVIKPRLAASAPQLSASMYKIPPGSTPAPLPNGQSDGGLAASAAASASTTPDPNASTSTVDPNASNAPGSGVSSTFTPPPATATAPASVRRIGGMHYSSPIAQAAHNILIGLSPNPVSAAQRQFVVSALTALEGNPALLASTISALVTPPLKGGLEGHNIGAQLALQFNVKSPTAAPATRITSSLLGVTTSAGPSSSAIASTAQNLISQIGVKPGASYTSAMAASVIGQLQKVVASPSLNTVRTVIGLLQSGFYFPVSGATPNGFAQPAIDGLARLLQ